MHTLIQRLRDELLFPVDNANLRLRADQLRTRLRLYPTMLGGQSLLVVLFIWLMWDAVPHHALLLWGLASYVVYTADMLGWLLYRNRIDTVQDCTRWHIAFSLFTAAGGLMWGGAALWLFPSDPAHQAQLIMVILGLAAASVTTNPSYPASFYIYALSVALPLIFRFLLGGDTDHWVMAAIMILYLVIVLKAGAELGSAFRTALRQRHENLALVGQLTEQKALAEEARRQVEAVSSEKSRFFAAASHDLRQPLQALVLFSEALKGYANDQNTRHLAGQIEKSVHALGDMFNELLDLSRLDAGMMAPRWQHFALQPLLDRLYVDFAPQAQAKGLGFEIPVGDDALGRGAGRDVVVHGDPFLLERMLRNLISNAIRYTDEGQVVLRCHRSGDWLQFNVVDTGIGIRKEVLPHIFEEYYQADNPHRDRRKGLGLGLAIVRRIEKLLDCRIEVHSEVTKGSTFSFRMPVGDEAQLVQPFSITHSRHDLSGAVVALVEDDPDIRQIAAELMAQWGCRVFAGELPGEVMHEMNIRGMRPHLLVCDYRLPDGLTAIHAIGQMRELWGSGVPAMVLTGDTAPQALREIHASGAMLLHKPITPARLRSLMYLTLHGD
jgi:signal transduction histidine kinase/CheY-like chemotaxis protein